MFKKLKISSKALTFSVFFGLLCAVFLSFSVFNADCEEIRQNVLRLHIIANSDSKADQSLKIEIRDEILKKSGNIFEGVTSLEDATLQTKNKIDDFSDIANRVIKENGFSYKAKAYLGKRYFETRKYEKFTLPAGVYDSLIIELGKGEGKNWWCVIFPEVCLPSASDIGLSKTVNEGSVDIAENADRYILRFKVVEIYEKIKNLFIK